MQQRHQETRNFSQIVASVEETNAGRLIARARIANRLTKLSGGGTRRIAYAVKARALACVVERFPGHAHVAVDYDSPGFVLVMLAHDRSGLPAPAGMFGQLAHVVIPHTSRMARTVDFGVISTVLSIASRGRRH